MRCLNAFEESAKASKDATDAALTTSRGKIHYHKREYWRRASGRHREEGKEHKFYSKERRGHAARDEDKGLDDLLDELKDVTIALKGCESRYEACGSTLGRKVFLDCGYRDTLCN